MKTAAKLYDLAGGPWLAKPGHRSLDLTPLVLSHAGLPREEERFLAALHEVDDPWWIGEMRFEGLILWRRTVSARTANAGLRGFVAEAGRLAARQARMRE